eukprot:5004855-Amphidinium_carterae.1
MIGGWGFCKRKGCTTRCNREDSSVVLRNRCPFLVDIAIGMSYQTLTPSLDTRKAGMRMVDTRQESSTIRRKATKRSNFTLTFYVRGFVAIRSPCSVLAVVI